MKRRCISGHYDLQNIAEKSNWKHLWFRNRKTIIPQESSGVIETLQRWQIYKLSILLYIIIWLMSKWYIARLVDTSRRSKRKYLIIFNNHFFLQYDLGDLKQINKKYVSTVMCQWLSVITKKIEFEESLSSLVIKLSRLSCISYRFIELFNDNYFKFPVVVQNSFFVYDNIITGHLWNQDFENID